MPFCTDFLSLFRFLFQCFKWVNCHEKRLTQRRRKKNWKTSCYRILNYLNTRSSCQNMETIFKAFLKYPLTAVKLSNALLKLIYLVKMNDMFIEIKIHKWRFEFFCNNEKTRFSADMRNREKPFYFALQKIFLVVVCEGIVMHEWA